MGQPLCKWYNTSISHSAIRFVTPSCRHLGLDKAILQKRAAVYEKAKRLNPLRWSGPTRNWSPIAEVHLNPKKETIKTKLEIAIDSGSSQQVSQQLAKTSAVSGSIKQCSNLSGVTSKNDAHSCPTSNASASGRGRPRGKKSLNDDRLRLSPRSSILGLQATGDYPVLESYLEQPMRHNATSILKFTETDKEAWAEIEAAIIQLGDGGVA